MLSSKLIFSSRNNHRTTIISVMDTLLEEESLVDVTLSADGQFLRYKASHSFRAGGTSLFWIPSELDQNYFLFELNAILEPVSLNSDATNFP